MVVPIGNARRVFAVGLWFRVVCACAFLVFVGLCEAVGVQFRNANVSVSYLCLAALVGVNAVYWVVGLATEFDLRQFYGHWLLDIVLISGVLYGLGSAASIATIPAYSLIIITSATFISRFASFVVASGSSMAFVLLTVHATGATVSVANDALAASSSQLFVMGNGIIFFYLFAFLAGTLASALSRANAQLALQNQELADKNSQLDGLRREIEFQTRVLTHDIKGPIAAAASAVGLLRLDPSEPLDRGLLDMAVENLVRADEMIEDLREIQRSGATEIAKSDVDLRDVCARLRVEFEPQLETRCIAVEIAGLPIVSADPRGARVVFRNLLANAVRYVPEDGTGRIMISAEDQGEGWEILVSDNGPGIPIEHREEVFRSFWKSPGDRQSKGLGLGLAIAKRVVEQHGGRISVGAGQSGGAEFRVFFPR